MNVFAAMCVCVCDTTQNWNKFRWFHDTRKQRRARERDSERKMHDLNVVVTTLVVISSY